MPLLYDGQALIPAPFVTLKKNQNVSEGGTKFGVNYLLTLDGKIDVNKGSPNGSGHMWLSITGYPDDQPKEVDEWLSTIIRKQEAIRTLFAPLGRPFQIYGYDYVSGDLPALLCYPRKIDIEFKRGQQTSWTNLCDYSVNIETDQVSINGEMISEDVDSSGYNINKADETWSIEPDENHRVYRLNHKISAQGKPTYGPSGIATSAWENARAYVVDHLGLDTTQLIATGVLNAGTLKAYNYLRTQNTNELVGTFDVSESWLGYDSGGLWSPSGAAIEEFDVDVRTSNDRRTTVTIKGTIKGLEERDNQTYDLLTDKFTNAKIKYDLLNAQNVLYQRCQNVVSGPMNMVSGIRGGWPNETQPPSGIYGYFTDWEVELNTMYLEDFVGINEINGIISYSRSFDDRPYNLVSGSISEVISVTYDNPNDVFVMIPIPGRAAGPIPQDMETITESKVNLSIEVVMPASSIKRINDTTLLNSVIRPCIAGFIAANTPSASFVKKASDKESFAVTTGRYSRQVSFTYQ